MDEADQSAPADMSEPPIGSITLDRIRNRMLNIGLGALSLLSGRTVYQPERLRSGQPPPFRDDRVGRASAARGRCATLRQCDGPAEPDRGCRGVRAHLSAAGGDTLQCHWKSALAMMAALSSGGLPLSVQFVGRYFAEATVFQVARAWERAARTDEKILARLRRLWALRTRNSKREGAAGSAGTIASRPLAPSQSRPTRSRLPTRSRRELRVGFGLPSKRRNGLWPHRSHKIRA